MSTLNVANIQSLTTTTLPVIKNSAGTEVGRYVRAFCRIDGTGTASITSDFNVSSLTDNGVGDYSCTFQNALPDANYAFTLGSSLPVNSGHCHPNTYQHAPTTTSIRVRVFNSTNSNLAADDPRLCVAIF